LTRNVYDHEMRTSRRHLLLAAGSLALTPGLHAQGSPADDAATREKTAPPLPAVGTLLTLPGVDLLDGGRFEPAQARGHVVLLYWWASWCPFCAVVSPYMDQFWRKQRERGLVMLALSIDRKIEDARAYRQRKGYVFPSGLVTPELNKVLPKPRGLPITIVVGRDGRVLQAEAGQLFPEDVQAFAHYL